MLRTILTIAACSLIISLGNSQSKVGSNVLIIDPASMFEVESDSSGILPPRLTTAQRNAQTEWDEGHIIYNSTDHCLQIYNGTDWDCFVQGVQIDSTIYNYNGTLLSDRIVSMGGFQLTFDGSGDVVITDAGFVGIGDPTPEAKLDVEGGTVRLSDYGEGDITGSESYLLGVDSEGDIIEVTPAIDTFSLFGDELRISLKGDTVSYDSVDLSRFAIDTSIYTDDGTLTEDRTVGLSTHDLTFASTDSVIFTSDGRVLVGGETMNIGGKLRIELLDGDSQRQGIKSVVYQQSGDNFGVNGTAYGVGANTNTGLYGWASGATNNYGLRVASGFSIFSDSVGIGTFTPQALFDLTGGTARFSDYGGGTLTGTETYLLGVEADGDVIEVDLSSVGTDNQVIDSIALTGTDLEISLEDDGELLQTVDLSSLADINVFKDDGTLTANRTMTMNGNWFRTLGSASDANIQFQDDGDIRQYGPGVLHQMIDTSERELRLFSGAQTYISAMGDFSFTLRQNNQNTIGLLSNDYLRFYDYGDGLRTGTPAYILGVEADGDLVDVVASTLGTDDQIIDSLGLTGATLEIAIEGDANGLQNLDLSSLDRNIYNASDTLEGNRTVELDGSDLTFGATSDVTIKPSGYVGIGDANPASELEVNGLITGGFGARSTAGTLDWNDNTNARSGNGNTLLLGTHANGPGVSAYFHPFSFEYNTKSGGGNMNQLAIPYNSTAQNAGMYMRTRFSGTWQPWTRIISEHINGNVGIGTINPMQKLEVDGGTVRFSNYGSGTNTGLETYLLGVEVDGDVVEVDASTLGTNIYNTSDTLEADRTVTMDGMDLSFIGADTVSIVDEGRIGIGTTTPVSALTIVNDADDALGDDITVSTYNDNSNNAGGLFFRKARDSQSSPRDLTSGDRMGRVGFFGHVSGSFLRLSAIESHYMGSGSTDLSDMTFLTSLDTTMYLSSSNFVGIGTNNPDERLHIAGNMRLDGAFEDKDGDAGTLGQMLTSTVTGTDWVNPASLGSDDQIIDSLGLNGNILNIGIEGDVNGLQSVDLTAILGNSENIYNTSDALEGNRVVTMDGNSLTFDGTGTGDMVIAADGDISIGTATANGDLNVVSDQDQNAFHFTQTNISTGEKDVFTIEDQDVGGGGQDNSSVLKVIKSGSINVNDEGFSLVELAYTGATDPTGDKYWISGRKTDEGEVEWGVDITDNDFWSEGGIVLGVSGAADGTYSGGNFIVEPDGDVGIGTTTPATRLEVDGGSVRFSDYGVGTYSDSTTTADTDYILGADADGDVVELNFGKNARWFYAPAVTIDASAEIMNETIDLYQEYRDQFTMPTIGSVGAPAEVPYYERSELYYYITYSDDTVVNIDSLDADGVLTYDIVDVPFDNYTIVNVIFVIK